MAQDNIKRGTFQAIVPWPTLKEEDLKDCNKTPTIPSWQRYVMHVTRTYQEGMASGRRYC